MLHTNKFLGSVLLIAGTSIGGGVLAMPIATATYGFLPAVALLVSCWLIMLFASLYMLEANLWLDPGANLVSMAEETLGMPGKIGTWITYLLLLYVLLSAYLSGMNDIFIGTVKLYAHVDVPTWQSSLLVMLVGGIVLYAGTHVIDYLNRLLVIGLVISFFGLSFSISPQIKYAQLAEMNFNHAWIALPVIVTSFGFQIIIPTIRRYMGNDLSSLTRAIAIGSMIPLACYVLWQALIMGTIPKDGPNGLLAILQSGHAISGINNALERILDNHLIALLAKLFAFYAIGTSFIGVSLSLFDFLTDGLHTTRSGLHRMGMIACTMVPPVIFNLFYPRGFILALGYGGMIVAVLLILLPALMVFSGRYIRKEESFYTTPGGVVMLAITSLFALFVIWLELH